MAHRLLGLRGLPFPAAEEMLGKAGAALLQAGHHDNALLPLDTRFGQAMNTPEDAVPYYFAGNGRREEALQLLRQTVRRDGDKAYWPAKSAWGGVLEVTADAARVMAHAGDALFRPAFTYVTGNLVNGRLYSTADTRALVELLASLTFGPAGRAVIDGREVALDEVGIGREVTALSDNLLVRLDEEIEINHLEPRADFQFAVALHSGKPGQSDKGTALAPGSRLKVGERIQITVTPKDKTIAPLARLFLPGNLALLKGGANAQTAYLPVEQAELTVDAVAVRPGRGRLYVSVHDMYDAGKVGTIPGIEVNVV
ncbi:MAG: hypothetical protein L0332_09190 [Chloroflexi bacterium]|nr:hypothetical protein [Chloroflexota bacterium]MCI0575301.1 hypothetical protein [Chloroflexota bacterium]MCI0645526.1 hypothetical protein [Chloroflexota bacterium]MCI0726880.1 hypothetical protein [Chloroflexota bacterium]